MLTVCTGWSPKGWIEYGEAFVHSAARHWSSDIRLLAYVEELIELPIGECRSVLQIPGCVEFIDKYRDDKRANGRDVQPNWKEAAKKRGYHFRWDAWKFCRQGFIPLAAAQECETEYLAWFDADVVTFADVSAKDITSLLPSGYDVAYLGRPKWSEIGFQLYRLPAALPMLEQFSRYYRDETVFDLHEWHSAYVFDRAREATGIAGWNLTPNREGDVWPYTPLSKFSVHLKGDRKGDAKRLAGLHRI